MKTLFFLILTTWMCQVQSLHAQNNSTPALIQGQVKTADGEAAAFATITLHHTNDKKMVKASYTDENGNYSLPGIHAGEYFLSISYVGYPKYTGEAFTINASEQKTMALIQLLDAAVDMDEIVVKAKKPMIEIKPDKTVFNIEGSVNAQGDNAIELLRKSPGVVVDNNDNIMLMGKNGVKIYIDNKPSPLSADDLANFLKSIQSSDVSSIEIITNPSSKYEAEGNAGIINIRLKKNKNYGVNATVNLGGQWSERQAYDGSVLFNYRNNKTNLFGSYGYSDRESLNFIEFDRTIEQALFSQHSDFDNHAKSQNFKAGLDYYLNKKNTFGILLTGYFTDDISNNTSEGQIYPDKNGPVSQILRAKNDINGIRDNYNINFNYQLDQGENNALNIDVDYGRFDNTNLSDQPNAYYDATTNELIFNRNFASDALTHIDIYTAKVDYQLTALKGTIGLGSKLSLVKTDNDYDFYNINELNDRALDIDKSNQFLYDEMVTAGYLNYSKNWDKWSAQAGIRVENTNSKGTLMSIVQNEINKQDYIDYFPSAGLSYQINRKNSLRLSYSRRLDRPNYQDLNPFEFKLDELSFMKGNPNLQPQYTNNIQLTHTFNYSLNTSLSYSTTTDLMTRITDINPLKENSSFLTWDNLSKQTVYSINVSYPFSPTKWWSIFANVTGVKTQNTSDPNDGRFTDFKRINLDKTSVNIFAQNTIRLPKDIALEISGFWSSPGIWGGNFETDEYWNVDLGLKKKLFDDRADLKISGSDLFLGQRWEATNTFGSLAFKGNGGYNSRRFKLSFTYRFGNNQVKSARRRKTGIEEEKKRTQSSGGGGIG